MGARRHAHTPIEDVLAAATDRSISMTVPGVNHQAVRTGPLGPTAEPALLLRQQQLSHPLQPILEAASDHAEDAGELDLHRHCGVEHVDDTGDGLTHRRDTEGQPVAVPAFTAGATAAGQQVDDLSETGFDAAARLRAAELVWDVDSDRCRHAPKRAAKRSAVQAACQ
jgi:hypothetical protein